MNSLRVVMGNMQIGWQGVVCFMTSKQAVSWVFLVLNSVNFDQMQSMFSMPLSNIILSCSTKAPIPNTNHGLYRASEREKRKKMNTIKWLEVRFKTPHSKYVYVAVYQR